jgi:hypothetical protein
MFNTPVQSPLLSVSCGTKFDDEGAVGGPFAKRFSLIGHVSPALAVHILFAARSENQLRSERHKSLEKSFKVF